jgi:OPA family sugar phosphate sensor protein UhpC-like MFS transporter
VEVLKNPYVWVLALGSSFMYVSRYAINSWGIFFLEAQKGYTNIEASSIVSVNAVCGVIGTVLSGFLSDRFFKGKRNIPALFFGLLNALAIALFLYIPKGHPVSDTLCMVFFGLSIGVLICFLGGLMAVDIVPKKAIGAALGIVGVASYIGAGLQDIVSGKLIEAGKSVINGSPVYDFTLTNYFWIGASLISAVITLFVWKANVKE